MTTLVANNPLSREQFLFLAMTAYRLDLINMHYEICRTYILRIPANFDRIFIMIIKNQSSNRNFKKMNTEDLKTESLIPVVEKFAAVLDKNKRCYMIAFVGDNPQDTLQVVRGCPQHLCQMIMGILGEIPEVKKRILEHYLAQN